VIRPCQDLIEIGLERASDKYRYPKAIKTIRRLRDSYHRAGDEASFTAYLADLRQRPAGVGRHRPPTVALSRLAMRIPRFRPGSVNGESSGRVAGQDMRLAHDAAQRPA
jgi:hypothetical protein